MIESLILGISLGLFSGLLPGVGNFILLLLATPILLTFDPLQLILTYVALVSISQFIGSVPAVLFGVPGEASSYPAVIESKKLSDSTQVSKAISGAAIGSFLGGFIVVLCCYFLLEHIESIKYFYSTKLFVGLLLFSTVVICLVSGQSIILSIFLLLIGFGIGLIGYNDWLDHSTVLTFGSYHLYGGIPFVLVSVVLFAFPQLYQNYRTKSVANYRNSSGFYVTGTNPFKAFCYSVIGFIGGLFPGLTTILSSYLAYFTSKIFTDDPVKNITASETANNSGAFSQLLPLLLFSIPLLSSEAYLLTLLELKGFDVLDLDFSNFFIQLSFYFVLINLVGLILAWPLANYISIIYLINLKKLFLFIAFALIAITLYLGFKANSFYFYSLCMIGMLPIAYLFRNVNTTPLIYAFLIHDSLIDNVVRLSKLL